MRQRSTNATLNRAHSSTAGVWVVDLRARSVLGLEVGQPKLEVAEAVGWDDHRHGVAEGTKFEP